MPQKRAWLIQGYDGLTPMFRRTVSSALSESEIAAMLKCLVARDLSVSEVLAGSLRKSMKAYSPNLNVKREQHRVVLSCGSNPHYIASLHTDFELREMGVSDAHRT